MNDPYFPIPFVFTDLPAELQPLVAAAGESGLEAASAKQAIADHWAAGGARTPALLLASAYLGVKDACEIMVDRQLEAAEEALTLIAEARAAGATETPGLGAFVSLTEEIADEQQGRTDDLEDYLTMDPGVMDADLAGDVAYELMRRERWAEAIDFFSRVIELTPEPQKLHYQWNRAGAQAEAGRLDEALAFYTWVVRKHAGTADPMIVESSYGSLLEYEAKDDGFRELFRRALAWAESRNHPFPRGHWHQEVLLERAVRCGMADIARHLCDRLEARDVRLSAELATKVADARRRFP